MCTNQINTSVPAWLVDEVCKNQVGDDVQWINPLDHGKNSISPYDGKLIAVSATAVVIDFGEPPAGYLLTGPIPRRHRVPAGEIENFSAHDRWHAIQGREPPHRTFRESRP